jgi:hypothetical protein
MNEDIWKTYNLCVSYSAFTVRIKSSATALVADGFKLDGTRINIVDSVMLGLLGHPERAQLWECVKDDTLCDITGCAIAEVVSCWLPIAVARVQTWV